MAAVIGETLSPHGLCSVRSPEQKAAVLPALSGFRSYDRFVVQWFGGHRRIVCRNVLQHSGQWLRLPDGSKAGSPCCPVTPERAPCRTLPQAVKGIVPLARC